MPQCIAQAGRPFVILVGDGLLKCIAAQKREEMCLNTVNYARCSVDPMAFLLALRRLSAADALTFVDVTVSQY